LDVVTQSPWGEAILTVAQRLKAYAFFQLLRYA
jgi:hypothetical protein